MATFSIKKEKDKLVVTVTVPALPFLAKDAAVAKEVVREEHARNYLESQGILVGECLGAQAVSNYSGEAAEGSFVYALPVKDVRTPRVQVEKVIKDLTPPPQPAIIEEKPKKRKRVKRDSKTGNETTS